jgi:hypothetical protein
VKVEDASKLESQQKGNAHQSFVWHHTSISLACELLPVDNAGMAHGDIQYR